MKLFLVTLTAILGTTSTANAGDMFDPIPSWTKVQDKADMAQWSRTTTGPEGLPVRVDLLRAEQDAAILLVRGKCPAGSPTPIWFATGKARNAIGTGLDCNKQMLAAWNFKQWATDFTADMQAEIEKYSR